MRISDVLRAKGNQVVTIKPEVTVRELVAMLAEFNIGAVVVASDTSHLLGIVSERDVVRKLRDFDEPQSITVEQIMTTDVRVCAPDDSFGSLMAVMTEHRVRHVPVLDGETLIGVLSIGDAVKHRMDQLEFERDQLNNYVSRGAT